MAIRFQVGSTGASDVKRAIIQINGIEKNYQSVIRNIVRKAADKGQKVMEAGAPKKSGDLARSIKTDHRGPGSFTPAFSPGGAGGGGVYRVKITAGENVPYFDYVFSGTGPKHRPNPHKALAKRKVSIKYFTDEGKRVSGTRKESVPYKGITPNRQWWDNGVNAAEAYVKYRVGRLDREIFPR